MIVRLLSLCLFCSFSVKAGQQVNTEKMITIPAEVVVDKIRYSMNFGYDSDCNCATVGTLLGAIYGHKRILNQGWQIVDRYKNTTRDNMPMDETIVSFADRVVDLFEMVNQDNGGSKKVVNNVVVYNIPSEKPSCVYKLLTFDEEKTSLKTEREKEIVANLLSGQRQEMAQAAYLAVSLDMDKDLKKRYPKQWKEACYNLSGYWKVINNIGGGSKLQIALRDKFAAAGFLKLANKPEEKELYTDMVVWKDPKTLYTANKK